MILIALLWACEAPVTETATDSAPTTYQPLKMGRISGSVTVSSDLVQSESGDRQISATMFILASLEVSEDEVLPHRIHATAPVIETLDEISVPYVLEDLFPNQRPYRIIAIFDVDASFWQSGQFTTTSGDLLSSPSVLEQQEVWVGSGEDVQLDLVLQHVQD